MVYEGVMKILAWIKPPSHIDRKIENWPLENAVTGCLESPIFE
jgi:hypothetical protein